MNRETVIHISVVLISVALLVVAGYFMIKKRHDTVVVPAHEDIQVGSQEKTFDQLVQERTKGLEKIALECWRVKGKDHFIFKCLHNKKFKYIRLPE